MRRGGWPAPGQRSRWAGLVLYIALVYATSPFTPAVAETLGTSAPGRVILAVGPLAAALGLVPAAIWLGQGRWGLPAVAPAVLIVGLYTAVWGAFCTRSIEAIHLAQYGLMSVLFLRALRGTIPLRLAYCGSGVLTVLASWGNELVQSTLPNRVYDLRDVALDGCAAILGLMVVWQLDRSPARHDDPVDTVRNIPLA